MTKTQISYFLEVAKCLNFSKAAENLYVSQPAVSKQIALMEAELGFPLFDRTNKVIRLTESGTAMQSLLSRYDRDLDALIARLQSHSSSPISGTLRIGCRASWNMAPFYRELRQLFASWPEISISLIGYESGELLPRLRSGDLDFALIYQAEVENRPEFISVPYAAPGFELLYSADFINTPDVPVTLADFSDMDFLYIDSHIGELIRQHAQKLCESYGFLPHFRSCRSMSCALMEINCNCGVMLTDTWELSHTNSVYHSLPLSGSITVSLVHSSKAASPLSDFFLTELQHHLSFMQGPDSPTDGLRGSDTIIL